MAKRAVKSLHRTGRVSRKKARAVAKRLRAELESGEIKGATTSRVRTRATASGRKAISFHVTSKGSEGSSRPRSSSKTARKASR